MFLIFACNNFDEAPSTVFPRGSAHQHYGDFVFPLKGGKQSYANLVIAQADNEETTDFTTKVTSDTKMTTTFYEAGSEVLGTVTQPTTKLSTYVESMADIKAFLGKPVLLNSGQWTTAQANNTSLFSGDIATYLSSVAMWANKIQGFNLIRGDFVLKVELNASPFQQGKLILHYIPCYANFVALNPKFGRRTNKYLIQKVQHPHIELDCRKTSVSLRVPYVAPTHFYPLKEAKYSWGTWFLDVYSALATGTAAPAGQLFADIAIYGYWENIELAAPVVPQSSNSEKKVKRKTVVSETAENSGPIEEGLRKVGASASIFSDVPILSEFAQPVEWAADLAARLAHIWGWSKPRELTGVNISALQLARYAGTADGPSTALPGGMISNNRTEILDYGSYTNEDEMSLPYLLSIPTYMGELTWNAGAGQGTSLLSQYIGPSQFYYGSSDTVAAHTTAWSVAAPFGYLANFFRYWRGGVDLTLKFVKTQMHSGRLQVTFTPIATAVGTTPTITNGAFALRAIVDIRTEDEVTFTMPYLVFSDYLACTVNTNGLSTTMGQLDIVVLNDLRGPESVSQSIAVQWFVKPAKDFEFAVPQATISSFVPYLPQSSNEEIMHGQKSGKELANTVIGEIPVSDSPTMHSARCIGERILSIKQVLLRNSPLALTTGQSWAHNSFTFQPLSLSAMQMDGTTGVATLPGIGGDMLSFLAPMFAFMRGSVNIMFRDNVNSQYLMSGNYPGLYTYAGSTTPVQWTRLVSSASTTAFGATSTGTGGVTSTPMNPGNWTTDQDVCYQHIPYYSAFPFTPTYQYNGFDTFADPTMPISALNITGQTNFANPIVQRAVGDDFQLMFFIGCPPWVNTYA